MTLKWSSATDQLYAVSNSSPSLDLDFAANKSLDDQRVADGLALLVSMELLAPGRPAEITAYERPFPEVS